MDTGFGEKIFKLLIKLVGQGFVVGDDQGRQPGFLNDIGKGEGFARTSDAQKHLVVLLG